MILMFVSTFLIVSLVGIIGITSCYLLCFDDDMDADLQNLEHFTKDWVQIVYFPLTRISLDCALMDRFTIPATATATSEYST